MNRNTIFMYIAVSLVMLVPVPGRLYYGMPVIFVLNLLMVLTTLFSKLMDYFKFYTLKPICILLAVKNNFITRIIRLECYPYSITNCNFPFS